MIVAAALVWIFLLLALGAGTTFAIIAFIRFDRAMTWAAAGALLVALVLAWFAIGAAPAGIALIVGLAGTALAVAGGGPAALLALQLATRGSVAEGTHGGILVADAAASGSAHEVLRGGTTIGVLERFATVVSIIAGFPEAIAIIVAVKGVGRFSELAVGEARERFIIGTLASLTWACLCGAIVRMILA